MPWEQIGGSELNPFDTVYATSTYTASLEEHVISDGSDVTLPSPTSGGAVAVTAVGSSQVNITTPSGQIEQLSDPVINSESQMVRFVSDGTDWYVLSDRLNVGNAIPDTQITRPTDNNQANANPRLGATINPNVDLEGIKAEISTNTTAATTAYIYDASGSQLVSKDISSLSPGDTFELSTTLVEGSDFYLEVDNNGGSYEFGSYDDDGSQFPYTGDAFDIVAGANGESTVSDKFYTVQNIRNLDY